jgi:hypothetical protein
MSPRLSLRCRLGRPLRSHPRARGGRVPMLTARSPEPRDWSRRIGDQATVTLITAPSPRSWHLEPRRSEPGLNGESKYVPPINSLVHDCFCRRCIFGFRPCRNFISLIPSFLTDRMRSGDPPPRPQRMRSFDVLSAAGRRRARRSRKRRRDARPDSEIIVSGVSLAGRAYMS